MRLFERTGACLLAALLSSCIDAPPVAGAAGANDLELAVLDANGAPADPMAMPRRPQLWLSAKAPLTLQPTSALLFRGSPDAALLDDLARAPLTSASQALLVPSDSAIRSGALLLTPQHTLARGANYTLAIPRSALPKGGDAAFVRALATEDSDEAGAAVSGALPADGSAGVPASLATSVLAFDGTVSGIEAGVWIEDETGLALPSDVSVVPCDAIESGATTCVRLDLQVALEAHRRHQLRTGRALLDAHGAVVEPFSASFLTGDAASALTFASGGCAIDEVALAIGCALLADDSVRLHLEPSGLARVSIELGSQRIARLSSGEPIDLEFDQLNANTAYPIALHADDPSDVVYESASSIRTLAPLATVSISEVRADPLGAEPAQEFVELLNYGEAAIDLQGFTLSDSPSEVGTEIDRPGILPAGGRALIVARGFDPSDPRDVAPAAGAIVIRVSASALTRSGLANSGEPLFLRDRDGHRISAAPATPAPRPGVCIVRTSSDPRSGAPGSFDYDAADSCSPGR